MAPETPRNSKTEFREFTLDEQVAQIYLPLSQLLQKQEQQLKIQGATLETQAMLAYVRDKLCIKRDALEQKYKQLGVLYDGH